ncbi:SWIM zinc finger [Rhizobiales bacterium GAS191]|jgi:uncharacterized Zn finger protein|nr:SWIM zinc finger [Rhizobiales bacterium GAS113]SEE14478.1 SWIM zinc finger [Rhizobiales bacterium GAS191]
MSFQYSEWPAYVPVAARRKQAALQVEKLRKKGQAVAPVRIEGRAIATTFWGKAWCDNLEGYQDYENRLPRGRSYVRNGSVIDLQIASLEVKAMVSGSSIYKIKVSIAAVPKARWQSLCQDCAGGIDSLVELLQGRFSKGVMERICRQDTGLFPKPSEIKFSCSCPDSASMCKHVAAVLYGVGSRLDEKPELLFQLRAVDGKDLTANLNTTLPLTKTGPAAGKVLDAAEDISALFGLEMVATDAAAEAGSDALIVSRTAATVERKSAAAKTEAMKTGPKRKQAQPRAKAAVKPKARSAARPTTSKS